MQLCLQESPFPHLIGQLKEKKIYGKLLTVRGKSDLHLPSLSERHTVPVLRSSAQPVCVSPPGRFLFAPAFSKCHVPDPPSPPVHGEHLV